jgi:hypothetical protein
MATYWQGLRPEELHTSPLDFQKEHLSGSMGRISGVYEEDPAGSSESGLMLTLCANSCIVDQSRRQFNDSGSSG